MVRKRGRNSRKYYDSEEDNDSSEVELDLDETSQAAPKQYSLRQRKRPLFTDFDYEEDEDIPRKKNESDDDFQVEDELPAVHYASATVHTPNKEENNHNKVQPSEELIDFEDMIRADIVLNKRKMNDEVAKIGAELETTGTAERPIIMKSKRGRPRKYPIVPESDIAISYFEPQIGVEEVNDEDKSDKDYDPVEDLEAINCNMTEEKEYEIEKGCSTEINNDQQCSADEDPLCITNEQSNEICGNSNTQTIGDNPAKQVNGDVSLVKSTGSQITKAPEIMSSQDSQVVEDDEDDDDVVFIEDPSRSEIIVLDD